MRTNVSGQCEVLAKCERTIKLPPNAKTEAPRVDGKSEKAEFGKCNDLTELLETEPTAQTKNFLAFPFRLAAGWSGGSRKKMKGNFCGLPREVRARPEAQSHHAIRAYELVQSHHARRACGSIATRLEISSSK